MQKERAYPAFVRKHCIARLSNTFLPQARQVDLADRVDLLLRQGYVGRNPLKHDYLNHLHNGIERIEAGSLDVPTFRQYKTRPAVSPCLDVPASEKRLP